MAHKSSRSGQVGCAGSNFMTISNIGLVRSKLPECWAWSAEQATRSGLQLVIVGSTNNSDRIFGISPLRGQVGRSRCACQKNTCSEPVFAAWSRESTKNFAKSSLRPKVGVYSEMQSELCVLPAITSYESKRVTWVGATRSVLRVALSKPNKYSESLYNFDPGYPSFGQRTGV